MAVGEGWDVPAGMEGWTDWTWFKIRGNKWSAFVVLSEQPTWYRGHYVNRRMEPCSGEGCKHCKSNVGVQVRYVFAVVEIWTRRVGLLELGRTVALQLQDLADRNGGLRGVHFAGTKHSYAKNSRIEIEPGEGEAPVFWHSLEVPDVKAALYATWRKQGHEVPREGPTARPRFIPSETRAGVS